MLLVMMVTDYYVSPKELVSTQGSYWQWFAACNTVDDCWSLMFWLKNMWKYTQIVFFCVCHKSTHAADGNFAVSQGLFLFDGCYSCCLRGCICVCAAVSFKIVNCVITVALVLVLWRINQQWQNNTFHIQWPSLWFIQKQTEQTKVKQQFNTFYVCGLWWFIQTQTCTLLLLLMKIKIKTQTKAKIEIRRCAYTVPNALGLARLTLVVSG